MNTALNDKLDAQFLVSEAHIRADAAAAAARVTIRELMDPAEHAAVESLFARTWALEPGQMVLSSALMRVMAYEGCYVAGVFDETGEERLIGAAVGFLASDDEKRGRRRIHLHSHIAGMVPEAAGRHAGFALKLHQRAWALERGIHRITWTFDPLVRGNAYFNLMKLGACAIRYLVDFYGEMPDGVNAGQGSDRLLVEWALDSPRVIAAADGARPGLPDIEALLGAGRSLLTDIARPAPPFPTALPDSGDPLLCATPAAIQQLRREAPEQARAWRFAIRDALTRATSLGYRITGFTRSGWYVLEQSEEAE
jgi:predicted GNAT superfamily acetyltransferase